MKLTLGFSPCPNDTFIFDALVNKKIDTGDLEFEAVLHDVQTLNDMAINGKLDISKISYGVLPLVLNEYIVLNSGGALGKGVGPLLIAREKIANEDIAGSKIFIPGKNTTAHMLFSLAFPDADKKTFVRYDEIESSLLEPIEAGQNGLKKAGVIIHENRFTYQQRGLVKLMDLGEYWEQQTHAPIPLGGIIIRRELDTTLQRHVDELIRLSLEYAFDRYPSITPYVKLHSQEMEESVMRQHIDLYVNDYSLSLKDPGKSAVKKLLEVYQQVNGSTWPDKEIFVEA